MLVTPQKGVVRRESNVGAVGATNFGTSITTGGSSSTKGTAVQLIASTAFDAYLVHIAVNNYGSSGVASGGCVDILTGAATEEVLIPNLLMGNCGLVTQGVKQWTFPLYVPAGSRLAAQAAGERTSTALNVAIYLSGGNGYPPFRVGSKVTTYGIGTVPNGVSITPGASGAEGSWTEITSATSEDHFALIPSFQLTADSAFSARSYQVDVGIGSATEEELGSYEYGTNSTETMSGPLWPMPIFQDIPSGTRLAMRISNSNANNTGYQGAIHAVS